jgi:peptidoglycan-associated lipoprotein
MKRYLIAGLLASCLSLSACKTTGGMKHHGKGELGDMNENSVGYFCNVIKNKVYFSTNKDDLNSESVTTLDNQASWLNKNTRYKATIEGHCDERGTREYNLALGERRANMVKRELVKNGVNHTRLTTVSFGKERPEANGSTEEAWAMNRRAVTVLEE